jgi:nitrogen fixation/metabolism regulation signal transduction histidine kinase
MLPRSIFARLAIIFLLVGPLPLVVLAVFTYQRAQREIAANTVEYFLQRVASDTADKVDLALARLHSEAVLWSSLPEVSESLKYPDHQVFLSERLLNLLVTQSGFYDLLLIYDLGGNLYAANTMSRFGVLFNPQDYANLRRVNALNTPWFQACARGEDYHLDWHVSPLVQEIYRYAPSQDGPNPQRFNVGFAAPVRDKDTGVVLGVWVSLVNWDPLQREFIDRVHDYFTRLEPSSRFESGAAFLIGADDSTILGDQDRERYGTRLERLPGMAPLYRAIKRVPAGTVGYEDPPGRQRIAGFQSTNSASHEGFNWTLVVGVDQDEIWAPGRGLRNFFLLFTVLLVAGTLLVAAWASRRITRPLQQLTHHAAEVARGNLGMRSEVGTGDELQQLAVALNQMTADLEENRRKLAAAEREAAWREMAKQVAHEIKNPLTPIQLSAQQLLKAYEDSSPRFPEILRRTCKVIADHVEMLRLIASDFSAFAGFPHREPVELDLDALLEEVLAPYEALPGLVIERRPEGAAPVVLADRDEMWRVFLNLIENAVEAMPGGGRLSVSRRLFTEDSNPMVELRLSDTGSGIAPEDHSRLFEPFFSTKSGGTGLGLAICRRAVTDLGGTIAIESQQGAGTSVIIRLPAITRP